MKNYRKLFRKLHRWPGVVLSFMLLYFGVTGIFMNHREYFATHDVNRNWLPSNYQYKNWNNAGVKGSLILGSDSLLVYGNIGIWLTDSLLTDYKSFNNGFPEGSDNRKIMDVHKDAKGNLYAATLYGLWSYDKSRAEWKRFEDYDPHDRFVGIESVGDTLFVVNRSYLFKGKADGINSRLEKTELPAPAGYDSKILLFTTLWQIHSGEIFGIPGKLFVDFLGLVTIFLSITGLIYFYFPEWIKRRRQKEKNYTRMVKVNRWSLKWHNYVGVWSVAFLLVVYAAGIFLRPPMLIAIAYSKVKPIKYSHLDQPNPWYDKLRDIIYDKDRDILIFSTYDGMYFSETDKLQLTPFKYQPPVSVMGITTFEPFGGGAYLIGSFSGLFVWHPDHPEIYNYLTKKIHVEQKGGRPVGDYKITGHIITPDSTFYPVDYDHGVLSPQNKPYPQMPQNVLDASQLSLWNVCLEIHTGRFFEALLGIFYILIVPLAGMASLVVLISGTLLWYKNHRPQRKRKNREITE